MEWNSISPLIVKLLSFCSFERSEPKDISKGDCVMAREDRDPRHHTQKMQKALHDIKDHLREDIEKVDEPS
jgi:hypothetical protein